MKLKLLYIPLLLFFVTNFFSQETGNPNYISGKIKVPLYVDQYLIEDHLLDDRRDSNTKYEKVHIDIYDQLNRIPIYFQPKGNSFSGFFTEEVNELVTEINISGYIDTKTNLGGISIKYKETKNTKSGVCDFDYEYSYKYEYRNLKVNSVFPIGSKQKNQITSYFFKPNENTTLNVSNYKYLEDTKCPKRNYSKEFIYQKVNEDYLKEHLSGFSSYFSFNLNWNGKTIKDLITESISITKIRDEDPSWEPPSSTFSKKNSESEPNSLAIYFNYSDFDEESKKIIHSTLVLFEIELIKLPTVKVLNRDNINKLIFEQKLSESGLVKKEYIVENKIFKEEIAIIIKPDINNNIITCKISSKSKELEIKTKNYMPSATTIYLENFFYNFITKEVFQQFNLNKSSFKNKDEN